jgi:hypothetical protein
LNADGEPAWTVKRLHTEITRFRNEGPQAADAEVTAALQRIIAGGAKRSWWSLATMYSAEDLSDKRQPSQGRELVQFYDEMFNEGRPYLQQMREQVRVADSARSEPSRPVSPGKVPGDEVEWLADLTVPDGVEVPPNLEFTKVWRLYNAGTVPWIDRRLVRLGPATSYGLVRSAPSVPVPDTPPDHTVDIAVQVRAPAVETSHCEPRWKMAHANGDFCFPEKDYGIGMILRVVAGAPVPDMAVPGALEAADRKLARLRAQRSS